MCIDRDSLCFCRGLNRYDLERLLNGFAVCAVNIYNKTCEPSHRFAAEHTPHVISIHTLIVRHVYESPHHTHREIAAEHASDKDGMSVRTKDVYNNIGKTMLALNVTYSKIRFTAFKRTLFSVFLRFSLSVLQSGLLVQLKEWMWSCASHFCKTSSSSASISQTNFLALSLELISKLLLLTELTNKV